MKDRRREPRTPVSWPVRLRTHDAVLEGKATDVSTYGICVVTAPTAAIKLGASYRIEVLAELGTPRTIVAEARNVDQQGRIGLETRVAIIVPGRLVSPRESDRPVS